MVDQATAEDLRRITAVIARHAGGVAVAVLLRELPDISGRTMSRRLALLAQQGVVKRRGATRRVLYSLAGAAGGPGPHNNGLKELATPDGAVGLKLSAVARRILDYVSRPTSRSRAAGLQARSRAIFSLAC